MPMYLPTIWFKWIDPNDFDSNKYSSISSKRSALEVDLGHPKELCGLHNKYFLIPDKIEIKK